MKGTNEMPTLFKIMRDAEANPQCTVWTVHCEEEKDKETETEIFASL